MPKAEGHRVHYRWKVGGGILFRGAVSPVIALEQAESRPESLAGLWLIGYLGAAAPVLTLGVAIQYTQMRAMPLAASRPSSWSCLSESLRPAARRHEAGGV